jgi:predicted Fe-Mo cluster-binding NifX family protein
LHRIAVSTTDGLTIYQHFGRTDKYRIYDLSEDSYTYIETREVTPPCKAGGHSTASFDGVLAALSDCEAIVVAVVGEGAAEYLMKAGMRIFTGRGVFEDVLGAIISKRMLEANESDQDKGGEIKNG